MALSTTALVACAGPDGAASDDDAVVDSGGATDAAAVGDAPSGDDAAKTNSGGAGDGGAGDGGAGDGAACVVDADCPASGLPCAPRRCVAGACALINVDGSPCDDGVACTVGDICKGEVCTAGPDFCGCSEDADCAGDPCDGPQICDKSALPWHCASVARAAVSCPADDNVCTFEACDAKTGACASTPANEGLGCSDGADCTLGDLCTAGACVGGPSICACSTNADCAALDDQDACNGTLFCDNTAFPSVCKINPASLVSCTGGDDGPCTQTACDPASGACKAMPVADGKDCAQEGSCKQATC